MSISPPLELAAVPFGIWGRLAIGSVSLLGSVLLRGSYKNSGIVERQVQKGHTVKAPSTEGIIPVIYGRTRTNVSLADFRQSFMDPAVNRGDYSIGDIYNDGDTVRHNGFIWLCLLDNTQNIEPDHANSENWISLTFSGVGGGSEVAITHGRYVNYESYSIGNIVRYEGVAWRCLINNTMRVTPSYTTDGGRRHWQPLYAARSNQVLSLVCPICVGSQNGEGIEGVRRVYFNDRIAIEDPHENDAPQLVNVSSPWRNIRAPNPGGIFGISQWLAWGLHLGSLDQTADTDLLSRFPDIWTENHRGRSIAYLVLLLAFNKEIYPSSVPTITCEVQGQKVFDPRRPVDGVNGDGFVWSDNPALCILDYMTSMGYGCKIPINELDITSFIQAAEYYDTRIPVGNSTRPFHTLNGEIDTTLSRTENLLSMLTSCRGEIIEQGGKYRLFTKQTSGTSGVRIDYSNIKDIVQVTRGGAGVVKNRIEVTYRDREDGYKARTIHWPPVDSPGTPLQEDANTEATERIELPFTDNYYNALYIAQIRLAEQRESEQVSLITTRETFRAQAGSIIELDEPALGYNDAQFWVSGMALTKEGHLAYALQQYNSGAYALDTLAERISLPDSPYPDINDPGEPENLRLTSDKTTSIPIGDQDVKIDNAPLILARWDPPEDAFIDHYEIQYRKNSDTEWRLLGQRPGVNSPSAQISSVEVGETYRVRVRCINVYSIPSDWVEEEVIVGTLQVDALGSFRLEQNGLALNLIPQYNIARSFKWLVIEGTDDDPDPADITREMVEQNGACLVDEEGFVIYNYTSGQSRRIRVGVVFYRDDMCTDMGGKLQLGVDTYNSASDTRVYIDNISTVTGDNLLRTITITGIQINPRDATLLLRFDIPNIPAIWLKWKAGISNVLYDTLETSSGFRVLVLRIDRATATSLTSIIFGVRIADSGPIDATLTVPISQSIAPQETVMIVEKRPSNNTAGVRGRLAVKFEDVEE